MTSECSRCGKKYPLEQLSFLPNVQAHIRHMATDSMDVKVSDADMHKLYCPECLKAIQKEKMT